MTVHPGFEGQRLLPKVLEKVRFVRDLCNKFQIGGRKTELTDTQPSTFAIQVDGGIDDKTAPLCIRAGANHLVAGTYLFKEDAMQEKIAKLRGET